MRSSKIPVWATLGDDWVVEECPTCKKSVTPSLESRKIAEMYFVMREVICRIEELEKNE